MVFTESIVKAAKNRYGFKSGTPTGNPKGYSSKYPVGMEEYIRSIADGKEAGEIAKAVSEHFGIEFSTSQCRAYKKNHDIVSGLDCRFKNGDEPANKGKKMSPEQYEKCKATMFCKGHVPANHMNVGEYSHTEGLKRNESWLASDLVSSYCDNNGIRWGVIKGLHIQHYEHGKNGENGGHFIVSAYVGKMIAERKVKSSV